MTKKVKRYVVFRIFGTVLDPREVTAQLLREQDYAYGPNERHDRMGRPRPNGMWQISSDTGAMSWPTPRSAPQRATPPTATCTTKALIRWS